MIRITRIAAAVSLAMLAAGCSHIPFIGSKEVEEPAYTKARSAIQNRKLEVPPDLAQPELSAAYNIPGGSLGPTGQKVLGGNAVLPSFDKVSLQTDGRERWLRVDAPAETVWNEARQMLLDQGFKLTVDDAAAGLLETNFTEERPDLPIGAIRAAIQRGMKTLYNSGMVDQFRVRLERSGDGKATEVYISHRRMEEVYTSPDKSDTRWTPRPSDPEREAAKLKQLLVRLGVSTEAATQLVASQPVEAGAKPADGSPAPAVAAGANRAQLVNLADGKRAIQLNESFDRAWRRIGLALERAGYNITDRDRSLGIYYISAGKVAAAREEEGFFSSLAFWTSEEKKEERQPQYMAVVTSKDGQSSVRIAGKEGAVLPDAQAAALLDPLLVELR